MSLLKLIHTDTTALGGIRQRLTSKLEVFWLDKDIRNSPVRHLMKSNGAPSESEIITIRALITHAEVQIEDLHHLPVRNRTAQVTESRLLRFIDQHKALLSPVRYLPSDILQEIFLHYAASCAQPSWCSKTGAARMPWRLGQISHRWREIALSLSFLWNNIQIFLGHGSPPKPFYFQAFACLMQRSGTSSTLKFDIYGSCWCYLCENATKYPIIKAVLLHSEKIEELQILRIDIMDKNMRAFQEFKGRLPNLRILRLCLSHVTWTSSNATVDIFEIAPALRQVTLLGSGRINLLLPWSQITHFEEGLYSERLGTQLVCLSSLRSLTHLCIDKDGMNFIPLNVLSHYEPATLPNLRTLKVMLVHASYSCDWRIGIFLECLTIPAVEIIKILYLRSLVPHVVSMLARSHEPSRLQKLALRTIPLEEGELSALLNLTPQLIELEIVAPPTYDILRLIHRAGKVMLVPMLQALYMHDCALVGGTQAEYLKTLVQVRCERGGKDSDDAIMPESLGSSRRNTLDMLRIVFNSADNRDYSQKILNDWLPSFNPQEAEAVDLLNGCSRDIDYTFDSLDLLLDRIEKFGTITNKVLRQTNLHINLRDIIGFLKKLTDQDNLERRIMKISDELDRLLLDNLDDYCWARTSEWPECKRSLVYLSNDKRRALRMSPDALSIVYGLKLKGPFAKMLWDRE